MSPELERAARVLRDSPLTNPVEAAAAVLRSVLMQPSEELLEAVRDALDKEDQRKACTFGDYARAALRGLEMKILGEGEKQRPPEGGLAPNPPEGIAARQPDALRQQGPAG